MEWKPIETAPRDGTPVLVLHFGAMHVAEYIPVFHPENMKWCVRQPADAMGKKSFIVHDISQLAIDGKPIPGSCGPTHWMPLPKAPGTGPEY